MDYIDQVFSASGALRQHLPNYEDRPGQADLTRAVHRALAHNGRLLAEGPCGVGKSITYLLPAIERAVTKDARTLVVTANKALQEQLIEKDLPMLREVLDGTLPPFRFCLVKGRGNYLCKRNFAMRDPDTARSWDTPENPRAIPGGMDWPSGVNEDYIDALCAWAMVTTTGDRADVGYNVPDKLWHAASVSPDDCDRSACPYFEDCFAEVAGNVVERAHIVVANYDLLYYKLQYSYDPAWTSFDTLVMDEAHEAPEIARRCFGYEMTQFAIRRLASAFADRLGEREVAKLVRDSAGRFFEDVVDYATELYCPTCDRSYPAGTKQCVDAAHGRLGLRHNEPRLHQPGFVDAEPLLEALSEAAHAAKRFCPDHADGDADDYEVRHCKDCSLLAKLQERATTLMKDLREYVGQTDDNKVYWIDRPTDGNRLTGWTVKLRGAPYDVSALLDKTIYSKFGSIVAMSATMTSGGQFDYIERELGIKGGETLRIPSPFDYKHQARFVIPYGIPFPTRENEGLFDQAAATAVEKLVNDCQGRVLALFTTRRRVEYVYEHLQSRVSYPVYAQGVDFTNKQLADMFREQTDSVLLATRSFWMGLDVQGEALSCLVIDKLPFSTFADPFVDMMKARHPATFWNDYYVPRAVLALCQGAGRLIRSREDRGVFVLLDQRLKTNKYGQAFLRSLPFDGFSHNLDDAGAFLRPPRAA